MKKLRKTITDIKECDSWLKTCAVRARLDGAVGIGILKRTGIGFYSHNASWDFINQEIYILKSGPKSAYCSKCLTALAKVRYIGGKPHCNTCGGSFSFERGRQCITFYDLCLRLTRDFNSEVKGVELEVRW